MVAKRDRNRIIDVAKRYYLKDKDQNQIASELGISKSTVSRMLNDAKEQGVIEVRVLGVSAGSSNHELEKAIEKRFQIEKVYVASSGADLDQLGAVAELAAKVFVRLAPNSTKIGFSWGISIQRLIEAIPQVNLGISKSLIPLVGGMPTVDTAPSGNNMIVYLAEKLKTKAERFDAPAVVESEITWRALLGETSVKSALNRARQADLAFVGIGSYGMATSSLIIEAMKLSKAEAERLREQNPAGDMCGNYFDEHGEPIGPPTSSRVIGVNLEDLKNVKHVVGVAAGLDKLQGVLGAIQSGCLNTLCIDEELAMSLLQCVSGQTSKIYCESCNSQLERNDF